MDQAPSPSPSPSEVEAALPARARSRLLKPTAAIHIANRFSLVERKVLNALIWHAQRHRFGAEERVVAVEELLELIGFEASKNVTALKEALRRLVSTTIEWNLFGQDQVEEWGVCTFLASARIGRGRLRYRLNPEIVERIRNPTLFAKIQLLVQTRFTSRHSLVLYEFLIDWLSRERECQAVSGEVPLGRVRTLLGFAEDDYGGAYKFFNRDVLKPSLAEINTLTDIDVGHTPVRSRRKVVALRLTVARKASFQLPLDLPVPGAGSGEVGERRRLVRLLVEAGLGRRSAQALVARHPAERITGNLAYLEARRATGAAIANPAAYLRRAIEEDFRPRATLEPGRLAEEFERFRERRCREAFQAMPEAWREQRRSSFAARLEAEAQGGASMLWQLFQKGGVESPAVAARFMAELGEELLRRPEETSLEVYAAWKALQGQAPAARTRTPAEAAVAR
jgi:hypothetical protein